MIISILKIAFIAIGGTWLLYKLLPKDRKELCLLPLILLFILTCITINGITMFYGWMMFSAINGCGIVPGIIFGGLWLIMSIVMIYAWCT